MNVCFLLGGFTGNGGIGRVTSILANKLCRDKKFNIYTLSYFNNNKNNLYHLDSSICQSFLFEKPLNMTKGLLTGGIQKLRKYLNENYIDILIACGALYYPISVLSCKGLKTKCICWEHSNVQNSKDHSFQLLCRAIGAKMSDLVVTLTKYDQKSYITKYHTNNVAQIYNPIDEELFVHTDKYNINSRRILSVGRLSYQKNFGILLEVAKKVLSTNPNWTWDIYGDGELRAELQSKIHEYGLEDRVIMKGQVNNLYSLYKEYAMLIMTSRYEGFPMTLLEGMANGLPLISFDILTGPKEIIENELNGYLIKPFDTDQMVSTIENLINDSQVRIKFSRKGIEKCKNYRLTEITNQWKQLLENLIH